MYPEIHYQLIVDRVAELHREADDHRRAREATSGRKAGARGPQRRVRAVFGKLRTS
ncbi:hypothetical protein Skr01_42530 [Sphaerisporangium krabiense]|uniref:Uncharacterized protein n=1 Tax=Sphaerisporangium krabiense TaxID=763782 RepID=A0A7W8Z1A4_9ACTN|nr:hypothetical protein [Sphaerisporangium krabiense]MBB5625318.1 hypothetical protein [Sphaerisporangium krabiense]GII64168.1 hypothetical protein Skr01_42530 [Sphaerisporangium krabiense]